MAHHADPLTLEKLAEVSGVSAASVMLHFRQRYSCTPFEYRERIRLQMAHYRLHTIRGTRSLEMIARQSGFAAWSQFERAFIKAFGKSPRDAARAD